jgi:hypothetical protein
VTSACATNPDADERPITITAWLAADLLRVLNELRFGQHGPVPTALRGDLDYHAGLLQVRIHRITHHAAAHRALSPHTKEHHHP